MMFWSDHDMSGWGYAGMAVGMIVLWTLVIVAIIALVRSSTGTPPTPAVPQMRPYTESPEQLLAARFARGEIDEDDYQQHLAVLRATTFQS
jgi:putative membrane protein